MILEVAGGLRTRDPVAACAGVRARDRVPGTLCGPVGRVSAYLSPRGVLLGAPGVVFLPPSDLVAYACSHGGSGGFGDRVVGSVGDAGG